MNNPILKTILKRTLFQWVVFGRQELTLELPSVGRRCIPLAEVLTPPQKTRKQISSPPPKEQEVCGLQSDALRKGMMPKHHRCPIGAGSGFQGVYVAADGGVFLIPLLTKYTSLLTICDLLIGSSAGGCSLVRSFVRSFV